MQQHRPVITCHWQDSLSVSYITDRGLQRCTLYCHLYSEPVLSVSYITDRGLQPRSSRRKSAYDCPFSILHHGSWIATPGALGRAAPGIRSFSILHHGSWIATSMKIYPPPHTPPHFQYPTSRIVDCNVLNRLKDAHPELPTFSILHHGSWIATFRCGCRRGNLSHLSVSYITDRGLQRQAW